MTVVRVAMPQCTIVEARDPLPQEQWSVLHSPTETKSLPTLNLTAVWTLWSRAGRASGDAVERRLPDGSKRGPDGEDLGASGTADEGINRLLEPAEGRPFTLVTMMERKQANDRMTTRQNLRIAK